jgi:PAS domain S-box-containing protein
MRSHTRSGDEGGEWVEFEERIGQVLQSDPETLDEYVRENPDRSWDWLWNVSEESIFFSKRVRDLLGYRANEFSNRFQDWLSRVHPEDAEGLADKTKAYFRGETDRLELSFRAKSANGSYVRIFTKAHAVKRRGQTEQLFGHFKMVEAEKEGGGLANAISSVPCGVSILDLNGKFEFVNEAFAESLGFAASELLGRSWRELIHPDDRETSDRAYEAMLEAGRAALQCRILPRNGEALAVDLLLAKRRNRDNLNSGHFCFCKPTGQQGWAIAS